MGIPIKKADCAYQATVVAIWIVQTVVKRFFFSSQTYVEKLSSLLKN